MCSIVCGVSSVWGGVGQRGGVRVGAVRAVRVVGAVGRGVCYGGCGIRKGGGVARYESGGRWLGIGESQQGGEKELEIITNHYTTAKNWFRIPVQTMLVKYLN